MNTITIDCGASFIKITHIKDNFLIESKEFSTPNGEGEFKVIRTLEIIRENIYSFAHGKEEINIGISNEMHGFVVADEQGTPYLDYVSWQDECGNEKYTNDSYVEYVTKTIQELDICKTGMHVKAGSPLVNLFYYINKLNLSNRKLYFYTLGDYYIRMLTSEAPFCHETNAAATGIYDIENHCWNKNIIEKLKYNNVVFPEVPLQKRVIVKEHDGCLCKFYSALGDQQAALLGSGICNKNQVSLNFGTGAQISTLVDEYSARRNYQIRPFFNGKFLKTTPHIPSGRAINVYLRFLKNVIRVFEPSADIDDEIIWDKINIEARCNKEEPLDVDLSFFSNAITNTSKGYIANISERNLTIGNLIDSIYFRICENVKYVLNMQEITDFDTFIITGGIFRKNDYLRELLLSHFPNVKYVKIIENETAKGINKYISDDYI